MKTYVVGTWQGTSNKYHKVCFHGETIKNQVYIIDKSALSGAMESENVNSNILKILPPKNENFQIKKILIFFIFQLKT